MHGEACSAPRLSSAPAGVDPPNDGPRRTRLWAPTDALGYNPNCLGRTMAERSLSRDCRGVTFANALFKDLSWWVSASASAKKLHQSTHHPGSLKAEYILIHIPPYLHKFIFACKFAAIEKARTAERKHSFCRIFADNRALPFELLLAWQNRSTTYRR